MTSASAKVTVYNHTHNYTISEHESAHPHKVYKRCSCGDFYYTGATNILTNCAQCCENAKYTLTASPTTLTMRVGETKTVTFTESSDGFTVTMGGQYSNDTLSNVSFSNWIDYCKKQVTFTAIKAGTGTINIELKASLTGKVVKTLLYKINILPDKYSVSYNANGGGGAPESQEKHYDTDLTLSSVIPTRSGYTFRGWATSSSASTAKNLPEEKITENKSLTLYAVWKETFYGDVDGNKIIDNNDVLMLNKIRLNKINASKYQKFISDVNADGNLDLNDIELINNLRNCNITSFPAETMSKSLTIVSNPKKTYYKSNEKLDLSGLELKVEYSNGVSYTIDSGYTCSTSSLGSDGNKSIQVKLGSMPIHVNVVVDSVKPTISSSITNNFSSSQNISFTLNDSVKLGGYFWGTSSNYLENSPVLFGGSRKNYSETMTISSPGTYYLNAFDASGNVSSSHTYTLYKTVFDADGGSVTPTSLLTCSLNSINLPTPNKNGYTFKGWTKNKGSTVVVNSNYKPDSNRTLYAVWTKNHIHSYTSKVTEQATCTTNGIKTFSCSCGVSYTEVIRATGHKTVTVKGKPATCTANGLTDGTKCSICGTFTKAQTIIKAAGHKTVTVKGRPATCTANGLTDGTKCSVCGTVTKAQTTIKATGHKAVTAKGKPATCTKEGLTYGMKCSVCGEILQDQETIKATGHSFGAWKTTKQPTYTATGKQTRTCTKCGATETKTIAKLKTAVISKCAVGAIKPLTYTGKALKPAITVKNGKTTLKPCTHYTATYKNNTKIGKATVTIKGIEKNGYSGTKTLTFNIVPANVKNLKATQTTSSIKLTWSKVTGAQGYRVFKYDGKKWVKVADTKSTSYAVSKLKSGTNYKYAVKAYAKSGSTTYYSASYTSLSTATRPGTPTIKATAGSKKAALKWNKQPGATGYVVYMATSKNGKYSRIATVKGSTKVSFTKTGLTKGKTYYFKVAAYKTVSGKNIYGSYSKIVSVKAK